MASTGSPTRRDRRQDDPVGRSARQGLMGVEQRVPGVIPGDRQLRQKQREIASRRRLTERLPRRNDTHRVAVDDEKLAGATQKITEVQILLNQPCRVQRAKRVASRTQHFER